MLTDELQARMHHQAFLQSIAKMRALFIQSKNYDALNKLNEYVEMNGPDAPHRLSQFQVNPMMMRAPPTPLYSSQDNVDKSRQQHLSGGPYLTYLNSVMQQQQRLQQQQQQQLKRESEILDNGYTFPIQSSSSKLKWLVFICIYIFYHFEIDRER